MQLLAFHTVNPASCVINPTNFERSWQWRGERDEKGKVYGKFYPGPQESLSQGKLSLGPKLRNDSGWTLVNKFEC